MGDGRTGLSRRQLLVGAGTVGGAAALGGAGSMAFFSDEETFANNELVAGELDLAVAWRKTTARELADATGRRRVETSRTYPEPTSDAAAPVCDLRDLKPGDTGRIEFRLRIDDNPGYLSLTGAERADAEHGQPESERGALSESIPVGKEGELDELLETTVTYCTADGAELTEKRTAYRSSLATLVGLGGLGVGVPLDGDGRVPVDELALGRSPAPFAPGTTHALRVDFAVPAAVGNGLQTDGFAFALGFYAEQARHNDR
jgi:predicted ribosomally synthesized peptide with SipW-like signal peptide